MSYQRHVFISYSHRDRDIFDQVKTYLQTAGITVWSDEHIEPGSESWQGNIEDALEHAGCVVALLSPDAKKSIWVRKELNYAQIHQVPIFGLLVRGDETTSVPFALSGSQHVDVRDHYEEGMSRLMPQVIQRCELPIDQPHSQASAPTTPGYHTTLSEPLPDEPHPPIRVLICDDHRIVRRGLIALLTDYEDIEVIGEASDGEQAVAFCTESCPDVVLMDMNMPHKNGLEATREIVAICPTTQVIVLTSFGAEDEIQAVLKAGAIGFLVKNVVENELASAIRRAYEGTATLAPEAANALIRAANRAPLPGADLSRLELEILGLMVDGLNDREIGKTLMLESTLITEHVSRILVKLGTSSRSAAVALAVEHKLVG